MSKEMKKLSKAELVEMAKKDIEAKKAANAAKPEEKTKTETVPTVIVNIDKVREKLPTRVSTKDLCALFGYTDGGKLLRKVLRAKFAEPSKHEKKTDWTWNKGDKVLDDILTYFAKATKVAS